MHWCEACREVGALHCSDPINCGGMQEMRCKDRYGAPDELFVVFDKHDHIVATYSLPENARYKAATSYGCRVERYTRAPSEDANLG